MSRRDYPESRYDDRDRDYPRRPRRYRDDDEFEIDVSRSRYGSRRPDVMVRERDRDPYARPRERRPRPLPDFMRDEYVRDDTAGALIVHETDVEIDDRARGPSRRRSIDTTRSPRYPDEPRGERVRREEIIIEDRERGDRGSTRGLPYPQSEVSAADEEVIIRERTRSRAPTERRRQSDAEEVDIKITRREESRHPAPRSEAPARSEAASRVGRTEARDGEVEEIRFRRRQVDTSRPPESKEIDREEITIRDERRSPPPRRRVYERDFREEVDERRIERDLRRRSMSRGYLVARKDEEWIVRRPREPPRERDFEREEIIVRRKERSPSPEPPPPPREEIREEEIVIRRRERSVSPERPAARAVEQEEIIIRRKERSPSPEPPPAREVKTEEEIIIRRKERSPSPQPVREPSPPPPLEPIIRPPIIQEVIHHHRHIDHGYERARSPSPPPLPSSPPREEDLEIEVRRKGVRNGKAYEEDFIIDTNRDDNRPRQREEVVRDSRRSISISERQGSHSPPRQRGRQEIVIAEKQEFERQSSPPSAAPTVEDKVEETKITIQRDRAKSRSGRDKMWTEITKDLVVKEAILERGYDFEENEDFYYVMDHLKYEDVVKLVEATDEIRRQRRERIREIQLEKEAAERGPRFGGYVPPPVPMPPRMRHDPRVYERDYYYDRERRYR